MKDSIIDIIGSLVTGGPNEVIWNLLKNSIDYKDWVDIFVEAGGVVANYENRGKDKSNEFLISGEDEQSQFRRTVFEADNMKKLAEHMYKVNDFDFQSELEKCIDNHLNSSGLSADNKVACKKHFIDIVINDIKEKSPSIMERSLLKEIYNMTSDINSEMLQIGNLLSKYAFRLNDDIVNIINAYIEEKVSKTINADYQRHNNRKANTDFKHKKVKWKLSHYNYSKFGFSGCTKEQALDIVKKWEEERRLYPKWLIIPYTVRNDLRYNTPHYIGKLLDGLDDVECMYAVYEFVWRYETGMFSYDVYMQQQIYDVWKKYYLSLDDNGGGCNDKKYINEWFYVGRALLREFKEDGNEKDWDYVWNVLKKWANYVENGSAILHMDKVKYYLSIYNMDEVRRLLTKMVIPKSCYDIYLNRAGIEIACGNLEDAKRLLNDLIKELETLILHNGDFDGLNEKIEVDYNENQVYLDSVYVVSLHLYSFVIQGIALGSSQYEIYQEEINSALDKADKMSYCFDFDGIIDFTRKSLLEWMVKRHERKESFELNRNTVNMIESNNICEGAYYLYRVLELSSFPIICNHVSFFGNIEIPWILALYNSWPQIALNVMVRCSKSEIGKYIITRRNLLYKDTKSITKEIRYLNKIIEYCLNEFEEIPVDQNLSVCDYVKNNIPEMLVRYMSRCPEDVQIEVLNIVKRIMEKHDVIMDNHMDNFIYMIVSSVSEKNKAIMFENLLQTDIVEHEVMYGHQPSIDLFTWYFRKDESKKYCERTDKISDIIKFLLSDEKDDIYTWRTKIVRLNVLSEMGLLNQEEKELFTEKVWSRINPDTKLPDIPTWYAWVFLGFESDNKSLAVSIKDYVLNKRLMFTFANERGCCISMREDTYLDEMLKLIENVSDGFWTVEEVELIFKDAIDYWEILKSKMESSQKDSFIISSKFIMNEYKNRIYKIVKMLASLYGCMDKSFSDEMSAKVRKFITELEQYNFGVTALQLLFETKDCQYIVIENIIENMYETDEIVVVDALEASYSYIKKYPDSGQAKELLENMIFILKTRKEPGLVSAINLLHNLVYMKNSMISKQVIKKLDKCLLLLDRATKYQDEEETMIKHKVLIRKSCMGLAYQILEKYGEYAGDGVHRWQEICNEAEFVEVKNEMV